MSLSAFEPGQGSHHSQSGVYSDSSLSIENHWWNILPTCRYVVAEIIQIFLLTFRAVVFRSGADKHYSVWKEWRALPVISVAPIRRPKLDESGTDYSFSQERELMKEKMRTALRIAATRQHTDLCIGAFGVGFGFRNPAVQVASMWRELLFCDKEFQGVFANIVFALESANNGDKSGTTDLEVFRKEFDASNTHKTSYR